MELLTTSILVILFLVLLYYSTRRPPNFPPGIARLPIIGQVVKGSKLQVWKSRIVGSYIGNHPTISIHDFQLAKELFNKEEYCGRGVNFITRYLRSDSGINKVSIVLDILSFLLHHVQTLSRESSPQMGSFGLSREDLR